MSKNSRDLIQQLKAVISQFESDTFATCGCDEQSSDATLPEMTTDAEKLVTVNLRKGKALARKLTPSVKALWDVNSGSTRNVELHASGCLFCTDGDKEDVCSYGVDSVGNQSDVEFATRIRSVRDYRIDAELIHGSFYARVYVAVRLNSCDDNWTVWRRVCRPNSYPCE